MLTFAKPHAAKSLDVKPLPFEHNSGSLVSGRPLVQRKAACHCGGECSHCQEDAKRQSKIAVSTPGDQYEQEADRIADQVMRMQGPGAIGHTGPATQVQRKCSKCEEDDKKLMRSATGASPLAVSPDVVPSGGGQPLPSESLSFFGSRFGYDFSSVRIHADFRAHEAARSVNAVAFTLGQDVVFDAGHYAPNSDAGRKLLAHELTHVVQQNGGVNGGQLTVQRSPRPMVQRQQATCSIDIIQAAKVFGGDKSAALKVLDCCQSGLSPLPSGCTSDVIAAAEKLLGKKGGTGPKKADCRGLTGFFPAGTKDLIGQCCKDREDPQFCCPPERISSKAPSPRCCNADEVVEEGLCVKKGPAILPTCPPGESMTIFGTCVKNKTTPPSPPKPPDKPSAPFTTLDRLVIEFNKDAPQSWHTFKTSATADGQTHFEQLVSTLTAQPDAKVQLEAHASSDKPAGDETYNKRLTDRRVKIVANELTKRKVDATRLSNPPTQTTPSGCEEIDTGQLSCGDTGASEEVASSDRKVVAQVFTVTK
jgi:cell wall-associated NlpC family hydrolase